MDEYLVTPPLPGPAGPPNRLRPEFWTWDGQERTRALNDRLGAVENQLRYYLGPLADPLFAVGGALDYTDAGDMPAAADASARFMRDPSIGAAAELAAAGAAMALPFYSARLGEGIASVAGELVDAYDPATMNAFRVWHGSPHDFDRFSLDKIGTGEGAQAYGHGLYFAEAKDTAKTYRDALRFPRMDSIATPRDAVIDDLNYHRGDIDGVRNRYNAMIASGNPDAVKMASEKLALLDSVVAENPGRLYEVAIDAEPDEFLDWDLPLSEQPANVAKALAATLDSQYGEGFFASYVRGNPDAGIKDVLNNFDELGDPDILSRSLLSAGTPGIKYFDGISRGVKEGSRNYVLFDDSLATILSKNGTPMPTAEAEQMRRKVGG